MNQDFPAFPRFVGESLNATDVKALDGWMTSLQDFLRRLPVDSVIEFDFRAGDMPSTKTSMQSAPLGVWPVGFYRLTATGPVPAAMTLPLQWEFDTGALRFPSLAGIGGSDSYRLRVIAREARNGVGR